MTPPISFFVPGEPKGQPRPRAFAFHGKARVFDPGTAEHWKSQIALAAKQKLKTPFAGPVRLDLTFYFPRPKKHYKRDVLRPDAPGYQTTKPDADNLAKAVMDALTTLGAWKDDTQVAELIVRKFYIRNSLGCQIEIEDLTHFAAAFRPERSAAQAGTEAQQLGGVGAATPLASEIL